MVQACEDRRITRSFYLKLSNINTLLIEKFFLVVGPLFFVVEAKAELTQSRDSQIVIGLVGVRPSSMAPKRAISAASARPS